MKTSIISSLFIGAVASFGLADAAAAKTVKLEVQSAWPLTLPASGRDAEHFSGLVKTASEGSIDVKLYSAGKLVPALQIFDAVQNGSLDAGYTSPLYVAGRFPAVQLFGGVPFGPGPVEYLGWLYNGGGLEIWREIYAKQGVVPVPCGLMDAEAGGWYKSEITGVDSIAGKKFRFAGLAGEVMKKLGASVVLLGGGDIYPNLERGVIDGTEFSMPAIDKAMGFEKVAKNYYLPGWHQPAAINELIVNKAKWDGMSDAQRAVIETACRETMLWGVTSTEVENAEAIEGFKAAGVAIRTFPPELLEKFKAATGEVMAEQSAKNEDFKRVWDSLSAYRAKAAAWAAVAK